MMLSGKKEEDLCPSFFFFLYRIEFEHSDLVKPISLLGRVLCISGFSYPSQRGTELRSV